MLFGEEIQTTKFNIYDINEVIIVVIMAGSATYKQS